MPTPHPLGAPLTQTCSITEPATVSAAFAAHVDSIPALAGYPLSEAFVVSTTRRGGGCTHQFAALTMDGVASALKRWDLVERPDALHVFLTAITEDPTSSEEILRRAVGTMCDSIGEFATIRMVGEPGITAGWASATSFATMNGEWRFDAPVQRESDEGTLGCWLPGRPLPAQNRQSFLRRFKHSGRSCPFGDSVPFETVQKVAAGLEQMYVDRPGYAVLSAEHCSVLQAGSIDPTARELLLSVIDAANAHAWMRIWHSTAVRSSSGAVASTYAIAAYTAWVEGEGMNADAYLNYANRAKDQSPLVVAVEDGMAGGVWSEAALAEVVISSRVVNE
jgi:hypothetical protein